MSNQESKISACSGFSDWPFGGGHALHDGFEHVLDAQPALGADEQGVPAGIARTLSICSLTKFGLRGGQIDFVDDRDNRQIISRGEKGIRDGLRFDALAGIDNEQRAFARGKRARNFVGEIHVAGRVDQIQLVGVSVLRGVVQADAFRLDGDAALALEIHRVEHLLVHFALRKRAGHFEQTIGERGLAVIDVRDDAKIAYELRIHGTRLPLTVRAVLFYSVTGRSRMLRGAKTPGRAKPCRVTIQFATNRQAAQPGGSCAQPFVRPGTRPRVPPRSFHAVLDTASGPARFLPGSDLRYIVE